jgi:ABC-type Co2+ transport system permease subunit
LLPLWLWIPAWLAVPILLALVGRSVEPRRVAYQGALAAMMLAAMAVPLGPLDFHLSLAGPVGVLLGPAAGLQVMFVVSLILAFVGHGGLTAVGLNTLILATAGTTAHLAYAALTRRMSPGAALAVATAVGQVLSGAVWFGIVTLALRTPQQPRSLTSHAPRFEVVGGLMIALWLLGLVIETVAAFGVGRFLARVHPGLLPEPRLETEVA